MRPPVLIVIGAEVKVPVQQKFVVSRGEIKELDLSVWTSDKFCSRSCALKYRAYDY